MSRIIFTFTTIAMLGVVSLVGNTSATTVPFRFFERRVFTFPSPPCITQPVDAQHLLIVLRNGELCRFRVARDTVELVEKSPLPINKIKKAVFNGNYLYLLGGNALFVVRYRDGKFWRIPLLSGQVDIARGDSSGIWGYDKQTLFRVEGNRLEFWYRFPGKSRSPIRLVCVKDNLLALVTRNQYLFFDVLEKRVKLRVPSKNQFIFAKQDSITKEYPFVHWNQIVVGEEGEVVFPVVSQNSESHLHVLKWDKGQQQLDTLSTHYGIPLGLQVLKNRIVLFTRYIRSQGGDIVIHQGKEIRQFEGVVGLSAFDVSEAIRGYTLLESGSRIYHKNAPEKYWEISFITQVYGWVFQYREMPTKIQGWDLFYGATKFVHQTHRQFIVLFVRFQFRELERLYLENLDFVRRHKGWFHVEQALNHLENALVLMPFFAPDSLDKYFTLRNQLYSRHQRLQILRRIFENRAQVAIGLLVLIVLLQGIYLYRKRLDVQKRYPSTETLHFLTGNNFFHRLNPYLNQDIGIFRKNNRQAIYEFYEELDNLYHILIQSHRAKEFLRAPREWRVWYRLVRWELNKTRWLVWVGTWFGCFQWLCPLLNRMLWHQEKRLMLLKKRFQSLLESIKEDVVSRALLPAIEKRRNAIIRQNKNILIQTFIKGNISYRFYPDVVAVFRSIFDALLQNAEEAFDDMDNSQPFGKLKKIVVIAQSSDEHLMIQIADNGKGMPEKILNKIFQEGFSWGKKLKQERGHGLDGVKDFIQEFGHIQIESQLGRGTTFTIILNNLI